MALILLHGTRAHQTFRGRLISNYVLGQGVRVNWETEANDEPKAYALSAISRAWADAPQPRHVAAPEDPRSRFPLGSSGALSAHRTDLRAGLVRHGVLR